MQRCMPSALAGRPAGRRGRHASGSVRPCSETMRLLGSVSQVAQGNVQAWPSHPCARCGVHPPTGTTLRHDPEVGGYDLRSVRPMTSGQSYNSCRALKSKQVAPQFQSV